MVKTCGIYLYSTLTKKVLVCHPTHSRWNNWSIPKGLTDGDEDLVAVGTRELKEETGIDLANLSIVGSWALPPQKYQKQNKTLESFLIATDTDLSNHSFSSNLVEGKDFPEIDKWKWVTVEECASLVHDTQEANLETIQRLLVDKKLA